MRAGVTPPYHAPVRTTSTPARRLAPRPATVLLTFTTLLALSALAACAGPGAPEPSALSVTLTPADGLVLNVDRGSGLHGEPLRLHFSGSMSPGTVRVTGSAVIAEQDLSWSSGEAPDDTLEVFPSGGATWRLGPGRTILVAGTAANGGAVHADFTVAVADLAPQITVSPPPPDLGTSDAVVLSFNFPADEGRLTLSGGLVAAAHTVSWSADHSSVTLVPNAGWAAGAGQFLVVGARGAHSEAVFTSRTVAWDVAAVPTGRGPGGPATGVGAAEERLAPGL